MPVGQSQPHKTSHYLVLVTFLGSYQTRGSIFQRKGETIVFLFLCIHGAYMCLLYMCGGTTHRTYVYMPVESTSLLSTLCLEKVSLPESVAHQFGKKSTGEF